MNSENQTYHKGHFLTLYISVFMVAFVVIFTIISIIIDNFAFLGIGPAIGLPIGIALGQEKENQLRKEGRLIDKEEKVDTRKLLLIFGATFLLLVFIFLFFMSLK